MNLVKATEQDFEVVKEITQTTISQIYPKYYPNGAVEFFKSHHNDTNIMGDIKNGIVYILHNGDRFVGTVTIKNNDINRLFVLPEQQHKGYGQSLLDFAEAEILRKYDEIMLDASLPAKGIYIKRGYLEVEYHQIEAMNGDYLCYDLMRKQK